MIKVISKVFALSMLVVFVFSCEKEAVNVIENSKNVIETSNLKSSEEELEMTYYENEEEFLSVYDARIQQMYETEERLTMKVVYLEETKMFGISNFFYSDFTDEELAQGICTCDFPVNDALMTNDPCLMMSSAMPYYFPASYPCN